MAKTYTIYRSSNKARIECDVFCEGKCIHKVYLKRGTSSPAYIDIDRIHLVSEYDIDQTLIPGVTKREIVYRDHDIKFADIQWQNDQSYEVTFPDEKINIVRLDGQSFAFRDNDKTLARIMKSAKDEPSLQYDYKYEPVYSVVCEDDISDQVLITIFSFPILYFGF